jgi:hypothetical protein
LEEIKCPMEREEKVAEVRARVRWFCATLERRMMTVVQGHLIIVDDKGEEHDFGQAQEIKFDKNRTVGVWEVKVNQTIHCAHHYVRGITEQIGNRPYPGILRKGQAFKLVVTYGDDRGHDGI